MINNKSNINLYQEDGKFNKPSVLLKKIVSQPLTARQKKIFSFCLRELLKDEKGSNEINTTTKEICEFIGSDNRSLKEDIIKIQQTTITLKGKTKKGKTKDIHPQLLSGHTLQIDNDETNKLNIRFDTGFVRSLNEINSYVKLDIELLRKVKNTNTITLYEILKHSLIGKTNETVTYTNTELRELLNLTDKYTDQRDFNRNLKVWVKEIMKHSKMEILLTNKRKNDATNFTFTLVEDLGIKFPFFKSTILSMANVEENDFYVGNKRYILSRSEDGTLLINDYKKYMSFGDDNHLYNFDKSFTLSSNQAEIIWRSLYGKFLKNQSLFFYEFMLKDGNDTTTQEEIIENMEDITHYQKEFNNLIKFN